MDLPDRCVVDSNIWMDLDAGGLLSAVFALTSAKTLGVPLLTGDAALRKAAEENGVTVKGTLWVLDVLVDEAFVSSFQAKEALTQILEKGRRLPMVECQSRLILWQSGQVKEPLAVWG